MTNLMLFLEKQFKMWENFTLVFVAVNNMVDEFISIV